MAKKRTAPKNKKPSGRVDKRGRSLDNRGRPPTYDPEVHPQAAKALCAKGATVPELAAAFDVAISTIWQWKVSHPEFSESCKIGAEEADERVERSFFERAVGYTHEAVKIFMPAGAVEPVYASYHEHVPPDPRACEFWLTNRRPDRWKNKQTVEHDTPPDSPIRMLAQQLMGTALRPQLPQPKIIEHEPAQPSAIRPQPQAAEAMAGADVIEADPIEEVVFDDEPADEPRIHTVSSKAYEEQSDAEA